MAFGCKEEGKLHGSSLPIFLHIRIEVETGVIERTSPRGFHTDGVTLAIGQHRAGKCNGIIVLWLVTPAKIPLACQ